jgi:hypothetical protein
MIASKLLIILLASVTTHAAVAQAGRLPSQSSVNELVRRMVSNELKQQAADHSHWMFRLQHEEPGNTLVKQVIETSQGNLERLLERDGKPLTTAEQEQENRRLQQLIHDRGRFAKKERERKNDAEQAQALLRIIPDAMLFTEEGRQGDVVRLRFRPDPQYRPPTRQATVFHHMTGVLSINSKQLRLVTIEGKLMDTVKFGAGLFGHLDKGGSFSARDAEIGPGIWDTTYLDVNMHGKVLFFRTIAVTEREIHSQYRRVPANLTLAQAAALLDQNHFRPQ